MQAKAFQSLEKKTMPWLLVVFGRLMPDVVRDGAVRVQAPFTCNQRRSSKWRRTVVLVASLVGQIAEEAVEVAAGCPDQLNRLRGHAPIASLLSSVAPYMYA